MTDYYQILGIDRSATDQEIKSAYRKLAMKHHPDRGGDAEQFQKINDAYSTLHDPSKKAQYDNPQQYHGGNFDGIPPGFEDIFGGAGPFGQMFGFRRRPPQNPSLQLSTVISLEDAFTGREVLANITLPSGKEQTIDVKIPAGIHENTTLRLSGIGDDSIPNAPRGDILLTIHINEHQRFKRSGDDLIQDIEISCIDAMLGKMLQVTSIDGRVLQTELPSGIQQDTVIGLNGNGMPNINDPSRRGRLLLRIKIKVPTLTEEQKTILRNLNL